MKKIDSDINFATLATVTRVKGIPKIVFAKLK